jgi:hypothetical protein
MDFEAAFSAFSVDEEGSFLLLLVGTYFEVLKRGNPTTIHILWA